VLSEAQYSSSEQSVFCRQATQLCVAWLQTRVAGSVQCVLSVQLTHVLVVVLQTGVSPPQ
jgi:hypothetical protein